MKPRYLHLSDGTCLTGLGFGGLASVFGEVVFSTGMTGYTDALTDPSFFGQILTFTYPLIGNYGVPEPTQQAEYLMANFESPKIQVRGVVCSEISVVASHADSFKTFDQWLTAEHIPGIQGIDTRALTQKIREKGTLAGFMSDSQKSPVWKMFPAIHEVSAVSTKNTIVYAPQKKSGKHIVLIDCGVKHGIIRALLDRGYQITRIPWDADPLAITHVDGVVCTNGPGDPKSCGKTIAHIKNVLDHGFPFLGICLGHQLLALAVGADTYKLPYGHRGLNQPCLDLQTNRAYVTSQNHGYAVNVKTIPRSYRPWFVNLNDQTNEGIMHATKNIKSVQFHPEGNPGPFDTEWIFDFLQ